MKKSKELEESKSNESSRELISARDVVERNDYKAPEKRGRGRPAYQPTDKDRKIVYSYAAYGARNEDIAAVLGINKNTVVFHFADELSTGRATAKNTIAQRLYMVAVGREAVLNELGEVISPAVAPNLTALVFLAKTRLGWRETHVVESSVEVKGSGVQIYLPDNGMETAGGKRKKKTTIIECEDLNEA